MITQRYEFGIFIPSMIPCVREKFQVIVLRIGQKTDNSELGIYLIRNSEFSENTKLLLYPGVDVIYTNLLYT